MRFFSSGRRPEDGRGAAPLARVDRRIAGNHGAGLDGVGDAGLADRDDPLPIVRWPPTPTWPPNITSSPISVLPAMPTCAAISTLRPMMTPCATCTRLSIFVPALMRVSPTAGRSTVVFAPKLHVVFDHHRGHLRNLLVRAVTAADEPVAVAADHHAVLQHHAIADRHALADGDVGMHDAVGTNARAGADGDIGKHDGADRRRSRLRRPRQTHRSTRLRQASRRARPRPSRGHLAQVSISARTIQRRVQTRDMDPAFAGPQVTPFDSALRAPRASSRGAAGASS